MNDSPSVAARAPRETPAPGAPRATTSGYRIYFAESLETFVQDVKRAKPTLFVSVPRLWLKFQRGVFAKLPEEKLAHMLRIPIVAGVVRKKILKNLRLDQVRFAGSGSAPIAPELLGWYRDLGIEMLEGYGMTENFAYSHLTRPGVGRPGFVGHPYEGVECRLGEDGEVLVKSPGTMLCYFKDPELTRESFTNDCFFKTGDRGAIDTTSHSLQPHRARRLARHARFFIQCAASAINPRSGALGCAPAPPCVACEWMRITSLISRKPAGSASAP